MMLYVCTYVRTYVRTYVYIHIYIYIYIYVVLLPKANFQHTGALYGSGTSFGLDIPDFRCMQGPDRAGI